jgi:GT2 family glycosyltransferase
MVYIIVLNWNGWKDTVACLESLMDLNYPEYKVVVCDNKSTDDSVKQIKSWYQKNKAKFSYLVDADYQYLDKTNMQNCHSDKRKGLYLIQTEDNLGYAGGNNVGTRFALNQADIDYVWVLNNDTEVEPNALMPLVNKCEDDQNIGICGSRMVYFDDRSKQQGLGGNYNKYLATTKHFAGNESASQKYNDDEVSDKIDYVIGAAILFTKNALQTVGLMCEDYFLYYEEFDYALRVKAEGLSVKVATDSVIYHKEGATTKTQASDFSDFLQVKNRLVITKKFYRRYYTIVWLSLFGVVTIRFLRRRFKQAVRMLNIILFRAEVKF